MRNSRFVSVLALSSLTLVSIFAAEGCSSSSNPTPTSTDTGVEDTSVTDAGADSTSDTMGSDTASEASDAMTDATSDGDAGADASDAADAADAADASDAGDAGTFTLTLEDYLSWCSVSVNGSGTSTTAVQTLTFPAGTVVHLSGDMASGTFVWGYWVGTAGDTTASHDTSKMTTVTMTANKTVQACCPFASAPTTPCPPPT